MLPSRFEYHRPDSLEEALQLLAEHGDEAKVLAGGQSLIPVMKLRLAAPAHLIDISRLGMDSIAEADGRLAVGALARHRDLERSDLLKARYPVMAAAAPLISDTASPFMRKATSRAALMGSLNARALAGISLRPAVSPRSVYLRMKSLRLRSASPHFSGARSTMN